MSGVTEFMCTRENQRKSNVGGKKPVVDLVKAVEFVAGVRV